MLKGGTFAPTPPAGAGGNGTHRGDVEKAAVRAAAWIRRGIRRAIWESRLLVPAHALLVATSGGKVHAMANRVQRQIGSVGTASSQGAERRAPQRQRLEWPGRCCLSTYTILNGPTIRALSPAWQPAAAASVQKESGKDVLGDAVAFGTISEDQTLMESVAGTVLFSGTSALSTPAT